MRLPLDVTRQTRCPVCKKPGPGTKSPVTPRPEVVSLSFTVYLHRRNYPILLSSRVMLSWDSGVDAHPLSRASIGDAFFVAHRKGARADVNEIAIEFCSTRCLRQFLRHCVDELDRRIKAGRPAVRAAKAKAKAASKSAPRGRARRQ